MEQEKNLETKQNNLLPNNKFEAGQIQITLPNSITHKLANGFSFGVLFGVGLIIGLLITTIIILGIVGLLALKISP